MGGHFTLSDDSHGIDQVGLNYGKVADCVRRAGIADLWYLAPAVDGSSLFDNRFPSVTWRSTPVVDLAMSE